MADFRHFLKERFPRLPLYMPVKLKPGEWVEVTAKVAFENRSEYQGEGIVLYAENVTPCEPLADEMVYFN